ncbi:MAG TPA: hypothetical protein VE979_06030 [Streptosporangiaceae bacterium]|jgi:hypothetical protein|nr:hypothetical protein [Streptosporangiaceae bacterium]
MARGRGDTSVSANGPDLSIAADEHGEATAPGRGVRRGTHAV